MQRHNGITKAKREGERERERERGGKGKGKGKGKGGLLIDSPSVSSLTSSSTAFIRIIY